MSSGKIYMSAEMFLKFKEGAKSIPMPFDIGIPVCESAFLPYRQRYKCCDVESREEGFLEGEWVHAIYLPEIEPKIPYERMLSNFRNNNVDYFNYIIRHSR